MAAGRAVNAKNLAALGADRLAELLVGIAEGDRDVKSQLRLALAASNSPREAAAGVSKRIAAVARATSPISGKARAAFAKDMETQRRAVMDLIAPEDPAEAFELMRRFVDMEPEVLGRAAGDAEGAVRKVFAAAAADLAALGPESGRDPVALAEEIFGPMREAPTRARHALIPKLATALGEAGAARLKELFEELARAPGAGPIRHRPHDGYDNATLTRMLEAALIEEEGPARKKALEELSRARRSRDADPEELRRWNREADAAQRRRMSAQEGLQRVADLQGDPDGYAAQVDKGSLCQPHFANEVAERYLKAGRPEDALRFLDGAEKLAEAKRDRHHYDAPSVERWEDLRIDALDAAGRADEAQRLRLSAFAWRLSARHLRAWLAKLPDFEDEEAEERELALVAEHAPFHEALPFLLDWPAPAAAARLLAAQGGRFHANLPGKLFARAARDLAAEFPLAATIALRELVERDGQTFTAASMKRAGKRLEECARLADSIADFGELDDHDAFVADVARRYAIGED